MGKVHITAKILVARFSSRICSSTPGWLFSSKWQQVVQALQMTLGEGSVKSKNSNKQVITRNSWWHIHHKLREAFIKKISVTEGSVLPEVSIGFT